MQSDPEHIDAEPGPAPHDISEDGHGHETALPHEPPPAGVQNGGVPKHDEERSIFLRVPSPETPPRLVSPNATKDRADEAEQGRETNDAVNHARERGRGLVVER